MKRPWQIWMLFGTALMLIVVPMIWLSFKAIQADRQRELDRRETELARQEAELQERVSSALYRLDLMLLPLVAQEVARPPYMYDSFYKSPFQAAIGNSTPTVSSRTTGRAVKGKPTKVDDTGSIKLPSPLILNRPKFVKLHFQMDQQGNISSPQVPSGEDQKLVIACCGMVPNNLEINQCFEQARKNFRYENVSFLCSPPPKNLAGKVPPNVVINRPSQLAQSSAYNVPALDKLLAIKKSLANSATKADNKYYQQLNRNQLRGNKELAQRKESTSNFAQQQWAASQSLDQQIEFGNRANDAFQQISNPYSNQATGAMQSMWLNDELVLARIVESNEKQLVQICWLDWPAIRDALSEEIRDLLPNGKLMPLIENGEIDPQTALTALPIRLLIDSPNALSSLAIDSRVKKLNLPSSFSGLTVSLLVAWLALAITTFASAVLLNGVIQMSERRAAFVSAVTHELRTPLTTFRMYAEMLAEKMVPQEKTQEYATTLRVEADRLAHLVENVLQFARLEKGSQKLTKEITSVDLLMGRFRDRLSDRAKQAEMDLQFDWTDETGEIQFESQPAQIEQILFNLVDNACKYGKPSTDNVIEVRIQRKEHHLRFEVCDHGPGVDQSIKRRMFQPFCKSDQDAANSAPGVGLGLALCRRMAQSLDGRLYLESCSTGACFVLEVPAKQ